MTNDNALRDHLIKLLTEPNAHISFKDLMSDFPSNRFGKTIPGLPHTAWELLEHLRICQWDILEFSYNPDHVSPVFPKGYWPETAQPPEESAWAQSVQTFQTDLRRFLDLISDDKSDILAPIPHGDGQTLLREALVLAKHNSYHLGQLALLKRLSLTT